MASKAKLKALIEEAVVDAHTETEQEAGFLTLIEDRLRTPFQALVVGEWVKVVDFTFRSGDRGVTAVVKRNGQTFKVGVLALEWRGTPHDGAEAIEAYRAWLTGNW